MLELAKRPVWVEWLDSQSSRGWMIPSEEKEKPKDLECCTLGFLVWECEESISVVATVAATGQASDPITIPRCSITKFCEVVW